jgi:hypothetical protein
MPFTEPNSAPLLTSVTISLSFSLPIIFALHSLQFSLFVFLYFADDPFGDPNVIGDPYCTVFVTRLSRLTTEHTLRKVIPFLLSLCSAAEKAKRKIKKYIYI